MQTKGIIVRTPTEFRELCKAIEMSSTVALDLETESLDPHTAKIVGLAVSTVAGQAYYVPVVHPEPDLPPRDEVIKGLKPLLEDPNRTYVFHNAKFDTRFFEYDWGIYIPYSQIEDTMLEAFCAAENRRQFGLKPLVQSNFGHTMVEFKELFPKGCKHKNPGLLLSSVVGPYACEDADYTLRLHEHYFDRVRTSFIYKLERQLWPVVQGIEDAGFAVDADYFAAKAQELSGEVGKVEASIYEQINAMAGRDISFDLSSNTQLSQVLYDVLNLPVLARTKTDNPSTDKNALSKLKERGYAVAGDILTFRSMNSSITTLQKTYPGYIREGRIHTDYNQTGATTGRFGSSKPNIQNVSKGKSWYISEDDEDEGGEEDALHEVSVAPREGFLPDAGHYLVELDFGQIEFVCMAFMSGEESLIDAYIRGLDIHRATASLVRGIPYDQVTDKQRNEAKMYNYLIIYGGSAYGLSKRSDLTEAEAEEGIAATFRRYPRIKTYMDQVVESSRITKSVTTYFGRKQIIPEFFQAGPRMKAKAERSGVNRIMQGTAADIQKMGLIRTCGAVADALKGNTIPNFTDKSQVKMVAQTHDSQTWTVDKRIKPQDILPMLMDAMSPVFTNFPRIGVDAKVGLSWGKMSDYNEDMNYDEHWDELAESMRKEYVEIKADLVKETKDDNTLPVIEVSFINVPADDHLECRADLVTLATVFEGGNCVVDIQDCNTFGEEGLLTRFVTALEPDVVVSMVQARVPDAVITRTKVDRGLEVLVG